MNILKTIMVLIIGISVLSCKSLDLKNTSTDFTQEFLFTKGIEGPAVDSRGNLYAVNFQNEGTIGIVDAYGRPSLFATLPEGSIGNGIRFDKLDNMYIADYAKHNILLIGQGTTKAVVYAHDSTLNQPNDIAIAPNGTLYASDPNWKEKTGNLWLIKNHKFILLEKNMGTTNGIEVSPDGKKLYVNESIQHNIWQYDIHSDGTVSNKKLLISFTDFGMDGMRCDIKGNLYVCRYDKGTVVVLSPEGKILREITLKGKKPTNIAFGGKDKKQCFVTMQDRGCFETFFAENSGR
jgi:sugar lactone lactonase YvrE